MSVLSSTSTSAVAASGFWVGVADRCGAMLNLFSQWRGTSVLALGESFGEASDAGKVGQVVHRLSRLNPALRVISHCAASQDLAAAGRMAAGYGRRSFDAALVFMGPDQLRGLDTEENFCEQADRALASISRSSRRTFLVTTFDVQGDQSLPAIAMLARRRRWLERTLQDLCVRHSVVWVPLLEEEGCVVSVNQASYNFSVDGFRPVMDAHEMWTARMLEQPALARLVFH